MLKSNKICFRSSSEYISMSVSCKPALDKAFFSKFSKWEIILSTVAFLYKNKLYSTVPSSESFVRSKEIVKPA